MSGWVKLHRQFMFSRYGRNMEITGFFHTLLAMTNFTKGFAADGTEIAAGQFMTSQIRLSDHFNCSRKKVKRLLEILEADGQIIVTPSNKNTIVTIVNWEKYQGEDGLAVSLCESNWPTKSTSSDSRSDSRKGTQYKNYNNGKNGKNNIALAKSVSPLAPIFDGHERATEIQSWLMAGEFGPQKTIFEKFEPSYLAEAIVDAYDWNKENNTTYKAGRFLTNWIKRDSNKKFKGGLTELQAKMKSFFEESGVAHFAVEA